MSSLANGHTVFANACPRRMAERLSMPVARRVENDSRLKLSRRHRISSSKSIRQIFECAHVRVTQGPIRVLVASNRFQHPRICAVVGKRIVRRAVDRNWCKRRIREWFRQNQHKLPHVDIYVVVRRFPIDRSSLNTSLTSVLSRLKDCESEDC